MVTSQAIDSDTGTARSGAATMRAMVIESFGGPEVLTLQDVPMPAPGADEVLVRVRASSVARTRDVGTRGGRGMVFPRMVSLPHILGGEHAGTVEAVGAGVATSLLGARVAVSSPVYCGACAGCLAGRSWECAAGALIGIHHAGSNAEFTVVPVANLEGLPDEVSFVQGALLAANGPLADAELATARTAPGDWVLVPGASGAVGSLAVGLAVRRGARVIALSRSPAAAGPLEELGAELVLDTDRPDLGEVLRESTGGHGVDVVIDNLTLIDLWERYWPAIARGGRIVVSGRVGDYDRPLPVDVIGMYQRRLTLSGVAIGDRREVARFWDDIRTDPMTLPAGLVATFPLEQAAEAHGQVEQGSKLGHFVLSVD